MSGNEKQNWFITGGCGFIGSALVNQILRQDNQTNIRIFDNFSVGSVEDLPLTAKPKILTAAMTDKPPQGLEILEGDVKDKELLSKVSANADIFVHLAANTGVGPSVENPEGDFMNNALGTFNCLEASRTNGISRFIFSSSGAPAGEIEPPIHEEIPPHPVSPYGASKLAGEGYCSAYNRTYDIDTVVLRFGNVYGPGSLHKQSVVAKFIKKALAGETLEIYGDGTQTRDFIYIDDLVRAILLSALIPEVGGETFQIASSSETTVSEIVESIASILEGKGMDRPVITNTAIRQGDVQRNYSDTSKALSMLGWEAQTTLASGLDKTIEYFINIPGTKHD